MPKDWRTANVTAIFKKGKKLKGSNYKPVSLTSLCCKIQEHVITSNVLKHLENYDILTDVSASKVILAAILDALLAFTVEKIVKCIL